MFISAVDVRGFRDLPRFTLGELERSVSLQGPTPQTTALVDGIELVFAALSTDGLDRWLRRLELVAEGEAIELEGDPFPTDVAWTDPVTARGLLAEGEQALRAEVELVLDPPLFGRLRELAAREPRVGTALARRPSVRIGVGALFASSYDALVVSIQSFAVGDDSFPTSSADRPRWLPRFLRALPKRFHRMDLCESTSAQLLDAATSRERFEAYQAWCGSLGPDGPRLRVARGPGGAPTVLGDERPIRRFGQAGSDRAALAAAIHLSGADVLWAESDDALLDGAIEGDGSALEQVWRVHGAGKTVVEADEDLSPPRSPTRFGRFRTPEVVP
jgi:hypothetical protein